MYHYSKIFVITSSDTSYVEDGIEFLSYVDGVGEVLDVVKRS